MLTEICRKVKELGIKIDYIEMEDNGHFGIFNDFPVILINQNFDKLDTSLTILHETAHFLNGDCDKYITNHFQNDNLEYEANKYMIQEVMKMLDDKYDFTTDTNYKNIINTLNFPYHLDGIIFDEFNNVISDKFDTTPYDELDYFYE